MITASAGGFLNKVQLLDVPGNGGLGAAYAARLQTSQELLLCLDVFLGNNLKQLLLPFIFHGVHLPSAFFCPGSRKSFS